jgi:hypothetical protein
MNWLTLRFVPDTRTPSEVDIGFLSLVGRVTGYRSTFSFIP